MSGKRAFGTVRKLPSGRYQARYRGPDGQRRAGSMTFATKGEATRWLALCEAELAKGSWIDDRAGREPLGEYATLWIQQRPNLAPRTRLGYESLLRLHIEPHLGKKELRQLSTPLIRQWRSDLLDGGLGPSTVAKAYRLLRSVLATAQDDRAIERNPCRIVGAGQEHPAERPVLTIELVFTIADAIVPEYRLLVLMAVFGSMRFGELMALRASDVDLPSCTVSVTKSLSELPKGIRLVKEPKTAAGRREVALPQFMRKEIERHLATFAEPGPDGRIFVGPLGATPTNSNFHHVWNRTLKALGLTGIHFHDLRHTGNHLASVSGASTRELMGRMGHSSMQAALIYQHHTTERDRAVAGRIDLLVTSARQGVEPGLAESEPVPEGPSPSD